jgi:tagatose 1,6-diphosphate aldolase
MKKLTIGKVRGLRQIATPDGFLAMCAMDHRGSLQKALNPDRPETVTYRQMVDFKYELCETLAPYASGVLLDPIFAAAQCLNKGLLPKTAGILVSIEATGYEGSKEHRVTRLLEGWSVEKIKRMGASAVKILLFYRPDMEELSMQQLNVIREVAADCIKYDIPFLVEPMSYPLTSAIKDPKELADIKSHIVIETARDITALPIDILKAEFPGDLNFQRDAGELLSFCKQLDNASRLPWVLLSAGVDFDEFIREVELACKAGASGFLGGRAIWQEAIKMKGKDRKKWLATIAVDRLKLLVETTVKFGKPWYHKLGLSADDLADVSETWYKDY